MPKNVPKTSPPLPPLPKHSPWLKAGQSLGVVALSANLVACEIDEESSLMMSAGEETLDVELSPPMPAPEAGVVAGNEAGLMGGTDGGDEAGVEGGEEAGIQNDMEVIAPMPPPEMDMEVIAPMPPPEMDMEVIAPMPPPETDMEVIAPMPPPEMDMEALPPMPPPQAGNEFELAGEEMREADMGALPPMPPPPMPPPMPPSSSRRVRLKLAF